MGRRFPNACEKKRLAESGRGWRKSEMRETTHAVLGPSRESGSGDPKSEADCAICTPTGIKTNVDADNGTVEAESKRFPQQ